MANKPRSKSAQFKFDGPHPVDIGVGSRVRARRILMGMSQERLADQLGVTFQQVQKYEKGANRVSASRPTTSVKFWMFCRAIISRNSQASNYPVRPNPPGPPILIRSTGGKRWNLSGPSMI